MTQSDQTSDTKEVARLRKALEKARLDFAEKDKRLHLANQKIEYLEQESARLRDRDRLLNEQSHTLRDRAKITSVSLTEQEHAR